jgi:hypothetical protein
MCFAEEGGARKLPPKPGIPSPEARYQGWLPHENFPRSPVSLPPKPGMVEEGVFRGAVRGYCRRRVIPTSDGAIFDARSRLRRALG